MRTTVEHFHGDGCPTLDHAIDYIPCQSCGKPTRVVDALCEGARWQCTCTAYDCPACHISRRKRAEIAKKRGFRGMLRNSAHAKAPFRWAKV